jgi:hypothetical protein
MVRFPVALILFAFAAPLLAKSASSVLRPEHAALELLERDWVLMNWALKFYDANHDILLQPDEAATAADAFRRLADLNHDGRVTPEEYRVAREAILNHG